MSATQNKPTLLNQVIYFFPIQLLMVLIKKNITILVFWALLFGIVIGGSGLKYGLPYLFLDPEYLDSVDFWSYFIVGFSMGGFIMAFNIASYIRNVYRFPFLATLSHPFLKYCINNSVIPVVFSAVYIYSIVYFQRQNEFTSITDVTIDVFGLVAGNTVFVIISAIYFKITTKDIYKLFNVALNDTDSHTVSIGKLHYTKQKVVLKKNLSWKNVHINKDERDWHVETYLTSTLKLRLARGFEHYDKAMIKAVFKQNHKAAFVFEVVAIVSLLTLGLFRENTYFNIPAAASVFLLLTMILMITSAMYTWIRGWTNVVFVGTFLLLNYLFQYESFNFINKAFGLKYNDDKAIYTNQTLSEFENDSKQTISDIQHTLGILENWKNKNCLGEEGVKPKFIMINCSGGGSRSAMWVVKALQHADSITGGKLFNQTFLITGASGGMVGAGYFRELYLLSKQGKINNLYDPVYTQKIGKDVLNSICLTVATNDLVLRLQNYEYNGMKYTKDRGYTFERTLNKNTLGVLRKNLIDYAVPEQKAQIPMLILSPTIITDGRRLLISPQPVSYLTSRSVTRRIENEFLTEAIEFRRLFKNQGADQLSFTSALRMSATFPYISPIVSLPSSPRMDVMDAGIRDNHGIVTSLQFLYTFREWIAENTSGVVIIQVRDRDKGFDVEENALNSIVETFSSPIGSFYNNLFHMQDFNNDQLVRYCNSWYGGKVDIVNLELHNITTDRISLSWRLTTKEKKKVINSINSENNQKAFGALKKLLN